MNTGYIPTDEDFEAIKELRADRHECLHERMIDIYLDMRSRGVGIYQSIEIAMALVHFNFYNQLSYRARARALAPWN